MEPIEDAIVAVYEEMRTAGKLEAKTNELQKVA
jgi:hypothetical protein